ncbi:MAG: PilN domain-containing protein [Deltaproteobacteria bacterium]|nr:PilN domain-containing protein [Deltaproteobacteria bacterium]
MIRINLLETAQKKRRKRALPSGAPAIGLYVGLLLLEGFLLYYWTVTKEDALAAQTQLTTEAQEKLAGFNKLKEERDELAGKMKNDENQANIFSQLKNANVGPANMLLFLAYVLTTPPLGNHAERVAQEQIGWNTQWDPDRAWFTAISQGKDNKVTLIGQSISHHDVDELLHRLRASIYFQGLRFLSAKAGKSDGKSPPVIEFKIEAVLNYDPEVGKQPPEPPPGEGNKDKKKGSKPDPATGKG